MSTPTIKVSTSVIVNPERQYEMPIRIKFFKNIGKGGKDAYPAAVKSCQAGSVIFQEPYIALYNGCEYHKIHFGVCSRDDYEQYIKFYADVSLIHHEIQTVDVNVFTKPLNGIMLTHYENVYGGKKGAQDLAIKNCADGEIVFCKLQQGANGNDYRSWGVCNAIDFLEVLDENNQMYEVIHRYPHKVYFDLDKYGVYPELLENAKAAIRELIPDAEMVISGGITPDTRSAANIAANAPEVIKSKTSYHIIIDNYKITNAQERKAVQNMAKKLQEMQLGGDPVVYGDNRGMKCVNQAKPRRPPQAAITHTNDLSKHLITAFINKNAQPIPVPKNQPVIKKYDITELPKFSIDGLPCGVIDPNWKITDATTALELIQHIPFTPEWSYQQIHPIMRFAFHNGIPVEVFVPIAAAGHASMPEQLFRNWAKCENYPETRRGFICQILQKYYTKMDYEDKSHFRAFEKQFEIPTPTKIETLTQEQFAGDEKYIFLNLPMGCGKTTQCREYILDKQYAWISPNIALANDLAGKTKATFYQDVKRAEKSEVGFVGTKQLLICMNSLHFIKETYDVLVLDEIETVLSKWDGDFMKTHKLPNWNVFVRLIKSAKRVILLDAFITKRSIELMQRIDSMPMSIFELEVIESKRTVNQVKYYEQMLNMVVSDLKSGKKVFIYYPWKKSQRGVLSMSDLHAYLENASETRGVFYNSEIDDKVKKQLGSINATWAKQAFVICNNVITCGVSYENLSAPFDVEYLFVAGFSNPRDIVQVSFRPRYPTSGIMHLCHHGRSMMIEARVNDTQMMGEIYASMFKNTMIELDSPLKETLCLFFKKANFIQTVDEEVIADELKKEVRAAMGEYGSMHSYLGLADITNDEYEEITSRIIEQKATQTDKLCHQKHDFKRKFKQLGDMVEFGWDEQLIKCADKIRELKYKPSVFNRIAEENGFEGFPENIEQLRLSPELRAEIFTKFKFKDIKPTSSASAIIKNIYNVEFGLIYISESETKTRCRTVLKPWMNEYFSFVTDNMHTRARTFVCQCTNSVLTPVCGHLLCGTCGLWALERVEVEERDPEYEYFVHAPETIETLQIAADKYSKTKTAPIATKRPTRLESKAKAVSDAAEELVRVKIWQMTHINEVDYMRRSSFRDDNSAPVENFLREYGFDKDLEYNSGDGAKHFQWNAAVNRVFDQLEQRLLNLYDCKKTRDLLEDKRYTLETLQNAVSTYGNEIMENLKRGNLMKLI